MASIRPLLVMELLKEHSDYDHPITINEIQSLLESVYGDVVKKRDTIKVMMDEMREFYNPELYEEKEFWVRDKMEEDDAYSQKHAYYLERTDFDPGEIVALYYAVLESKVFSKEACVSICKKMERSMSKHIRETVSTGLQEDGKTKTTNKEVVLNIEKIHAAISQKNALSFQYLHYNLDKKLVAKQNAKPHEVIPIAITHSDGKNYLAAYHLHYKQITIYRIDKISGAKEVVISPSFYQEQEIPKVDMSNMVYMHADKLINVELRCEMRILDNIIDQFENCKILKDPTSEQYFIAKVHQVSDIGTRYWALQFSSACEVLKPVSLRMDVKKTLLTALSWYQRDENVEDKSASTTKGNEYGKDI